MSQTTEINLMALKGLFNVHEFFKTSKKIRLSQHIPIYRLNVKWPSIYVGCITYLPKLKLTETHSLAHYIERNFT